MKDYCKSCKHENDIGYCDKCLYSHRLEERGMPPTEYEARPKPLTHADELRAMSDEELAEIIFGGCPPIDKCIDREDYNAPAGSYCKQCWFDWLRQEAET